MKTKLLYLLPAAVFWMAARPVDVLSELHITLDEVRNYTFHMLTTEDTDLELPAPVRKIGKQMAVGSRTAAVRAMGALVKAYVQSAEFRDRFDHQVREQYHVSEEQTAETQLAGQMEVSDLHAAADQQARQATAAFAQLPASTLAIMAQQQMQTMQQQLATAPSGCDKAMIGRDIAVLRQLQGLSTNNPAEFKTQYIDFMNRYLARASKPGLERQTERLAEAKTKVADYQQRLARYKANADPNTVIKKRLWAFIALAERVDFTAKTVSMGYRIEFVRPDYRAQSNEWKLLYRIGQEPVMAARDIARAWLTELQ